MSAPKILFYDIESSPNLAYCWGMWEQNVIAFKSQWEMLSVAFKWFGQSEVACISRRTHSEKEIVKKIHALFEEADFLVAHNGDEFDWKKVNAKFIEFDFKPPSPSVNIDTKKLAKKYFKFNSNKLDDLCEKLGIGRKTQTGGFELWLGCMRGDKKSFLKMEEYNRNDVQILEKLYVKLRPWIYKQPGISVALDRISCRSCGDSDVIKRGHRLIAGTIRHGYQCKACGSWFTGAIVK